MSFPPSCRLNHRGTMTHGTKHRLELLPLEDRVSPGQTGLGSALVLSFLGPALAVLQINVLVQNADSADFTQDAEPTNTPAGSSGLRLSESEGMTTHRDAGPI